MDFYFDSPETLANPFADVLAPPRAKGTPTPSAVSTSPAPSVSFSSSVFYDLHPLLVWPPAVSCSPAALAGSSSQQQQPHASTVVEPEVEVQFDLQLLKQRPGNCAMELLLLQGEQLLARQRVSGTIGLNKCRVAIPATAQPGVITIVLTQAGQPPSLHALQQGACLLAAHSPACLSEVQQLFSSMVNESRTAGEGAEPLASEPQGSKTSVPAPEVDFRVDAGSLPADQLLWCSVAWQCHLRAMLTDLQYVLSMLGPGSSGSAAQPCSTAPASAAITWQDNGLLAASPAAGGQTPQQQEPAADEDVQTVTTVLTELAAFAADNDCLSLMDLVEAAAEAQHSSPSSPAQHSRLPAGSTRRMVHSSAPSPAAASHAMQQLYSNCSSCCSSPAGPASFLRHPHGMASPRSYVSSRPQQPRRPSQIDEMLELLEHSSAAAITSSTAAPVTVSCDCSSKAHLPYQLAQALPDAGGVLCKPWELAVVLLVLVLLGVLTVL